MPISDNQVLTFVQILANKQNEVTGCCDIIAVTVQNSDSQLQTIEQTFFLRSNPHFPLFLRVVK